MSVTIVTCVYNGACFLDRYLKSLYEIMSEVESVIIINDGSTDDTERLLSEIKHPKISVFYKPNSGLPDSRNYGLNLVQSEYVLFLDVDDTLILPGLVAAKSLIGRGVCAVVGGVRYVDESGEQSSYLKILTSLKALSYRFLSAPSEKIFYNNYAVTPGAVLFRSALAKKTLFNPELTIGEDWEFFTRYFSHGLVVVSGVSMINYMVVQASMSQATLKDTVKVELLKDRLTYNYSELVCAQALSYRKHLNVVFELFSEKRLGYPRPILKTVLLHFRWLKVSPRSFAYVCTSMIKFISSRVKKC